MQHWSNYWAVSLLITEGSIGGNEYSWLNSLKKEGETLDYYRILGVSPQSSVDVIKMAYKTLAKKYHPDIYPGDKAFAEEKMKQLNEAYQVLSDPEARVEYDRKREDVESVSHNEPESEPQPRSENSAEPVRYCRQCGRIISDTAVFCNYCGCRVGVDVSQSADEKVEQFTEDQYRKKQHSVRAWFWAPVTICIILISVLVIRTHNLNAQMDTYVYDRSSIPAATPASSGNDDVELIKNGYFKTFSKTKTIGAAFQKFFAEPDWKLVQDNGTDYVQFQGDATDSKTNHRVTFLFTIDYGDWRIISWKVDGVDQQLGNLSAILTKVYAAGGDQQ